MMEIGVTAAVEPPYQSSALVHRLMCLELKKLIDKISKVFSEIESARPRCKSGITALCSLREAMDKANLLIQHCSDSSKLYLAITANKIFMRCENIRRTLENSMSQVQDNVPPWLADKISPIVGELRSAQFLIEPSEHEAASVILALVQQYIPPSGSIRSEIETLQIAALRLNITSPLSLLIEKRSIKRLYNKVRQSDPKKEKILNYFFYLLKKYGELIWRHQNVGPMHEEQYFPSLEPEQGVQIVGDEKACADIRIPEPPEQFKCPISRRLLYDPVAIASGKTFERVWIERWVNEGNQICPVTHMRLANLSLTPNLAMKSFISKWCLSHKIIMPELNAEQIPLLRFSHRTFSKSIASVDCSMGVLQIQISSVSLESSDSDCTLGLLDGKNEDDFTPELPQVNVDLYGQDTSVHDITEAFLCELSTLSWGSQCKAVENVKEKLKKTDKAWNLDFSSSQLIALIKFVQDATKICDVNVQKDGTEVLLAILSNSRFELAPCHEDVIYLLASLLDSELSGQSLEVMEVLSRQEYYNSRIVASGVLPSIMKVFDARIRELDNSAMKILFNLSNNSDIGYHIAYLDYIPKLVSFLDDPILAGYCIGIMKSVCNVPEARIAVAEANLCMTSIAKLLEAGTKEEQEHTVEVLLSLCYESARLCWLVLRENIIPSLTYISVNGNSRAKVIARELIQLMEHVKESDGLESSTPCINFCQGNAQDSSNCCLEGKKRSSKAFGLLMKKVSRLLPAKH